MEKGRLVCCQCLAVADDRAGGWRAYRADVPGEDAAPILVFYCPSCAQLLFGGASTAQREVKQLVRALQSAAESAEPDAGESGETRTHTVGRYLRRRFSR